MRLHPVALLFWGLLASGCTLLDFRAREPNRLTIAPPGELAANQTLHVRIETAGDAKRAHLLLDGGPLPGIFPVNQWLDVDVGGIPEGPHRLSVLAVEAQPPMANEERVLLIDRVAPTATFTVDPANQVSTDPFVVEITFSEPVSGLLEPVLEFHRFLSHHPLDGRLYRHRVRGLTPGPRRIRPAALRVRRGPGLVSDHRPGRQLRHGHSRLFPAGSLHLVRSLAATSRRKRARLHGDALQGHVLGPARRVPRRHAAGVGRRAAPLERGSGRLGRLHGDPYAPVHDPGGFTGTPARCSRPWSSIAPRRRWSDATVFRHAPKGSSSMKASRSTSTSPLARRRRR